MSYLPEGGAYKEESRRGCVETMHPLFCINKAPTFPSQGFVMSKRICIFRH